MLSRSAPVRFLVTHRALPVRRTLAAGNLPVRTLVDQAGQEFLLFISVVEVTCGTQTTAVFRLGVGPVTVNHSGQLPAVTVSFDLAPGVSLGAALGEVEQAAREVLPPSVVGSFAGTAQ